MNDSNHGKKAYEKPRLEVYGSLTDITKATNTGNNTDSATKGSNKTA